MKIQKLNWAGIKLDCGNKVVLIDAVEDFKPYYTILGAPQTPLIQFTNVVKADYILFTHLHLDHFDVSVIDKCLKPEGKIIGFKKLETALSKLNRATVYLDYNEEYTDEGVSFKSAFSLDGIGDEQTAWIVSYQDKKIFHGGDTIWHNQFWKLAKENANIDYAFLPVNAAVANFPMIHLEYSTVPVSLTLEQAFNAAKLLHAKQLIPIHYQKFSTPYYLPKEVTETDFLQLSKAIGQPYQIVEDGEYLT
jgi:L-ascorbate metabolism protein UlaG (beta-lactamase superfamily)